MKRRSTFLLLAVLCCFGFLRAQAEAAKPNVLFIISDDLNYMLGDSGHPECKTPHLDAFAERAMSFSRAYCQFPLCGPSRASIMSGQYPKKNGVMNNGRMLKETRVTLPLHFQQHGYWSARVSKIYHMGIPGDVFKGSSGTDHKASWNAAHNITAMETLTPGKAEDFTKPASVKSFPAERVQWRKDHERGGPIAFSSGARGHYTVVEVTNEDEGLLADTMATDKAIEILRERATPEKSTSPFFLAVGLIRPHFPFVSTERDLEPYIATDLSTPHVPSDDYDDIPKAAINARMDFERAPIQKLRRGYLGAVSYMDRQVGRLLAELERLELHKNTIVVFVSDHGYMLGEHEMWKKTKLWEDAIHVPLLISLPGQTTGRVCERPVELIDLYPTLAELAGLPAEPEAQGLSLVPLLKDPDSDRVAKPAALIQIGLGHCLRTEKWAYMWYPEKKKRAEAFMLFDMDSDPNQYTNLADEPDHAITRKTLHQRLLERLADAEK